MPLKLNCPRCKKALTLPRSTAGSYTKCAHCGGRVWVPEVPGPEAKKPTGARAPGGKASAAASGSPAYPPPPPTAASPAAPPNVPPSPSHTPSPPEPATPSPAPATPPAAPWTAQGQAQGQDATSPERRKARFVTARTAESRLKPGADGKLPGLKLEQDEPAEQPKKKADGTSLHPLVLFCALCLSVLLSITMVLLDVESPQNERDRERAQARWTIEREYFSHLDPNEPLVEYQLLLREAQRAHARADRQAERDTYRRVLRLLRAERDRFEGLTGSPSNDRKLQELITVILHE